MQSNLNAQSMPQDPLKRTAAALAALAYALKATNIRDTAPGYAQLADVITAARAHGAEQTDLDVIRAAAEEAIGLLEPMVAALKTIRKATGSARRRRNPAAAESAERPRSDGPR